MILDLFFRWTTEGRSSVLQVLAMLQRAQQCSGILARHLAARAALSSGSGAPVLASLLAPLACAFPSSSILAPPSTLHTPAYACAVPAHSFRTSVRSSPSVSSQLAHAPTIIRGCATWPLTPHATKLTHFW